MIAIYARVSTGLQVAEGTSLERQIELCYKKAHELGFSDEEIKVYREEGSTGEDIDRPALNRLRNDVFLGLITHVICTHPDRLSRDLTDKLIICREFERHGAQLVFVDAEYRNTAEGQLFFNIQSVIAQYELAQIKRRTVRGRLDAVRKKQKIMPMRVAPFGYNFSDGKLVINEREAKFVRLIYEWYVYDKLTMREIGERLCELGCYPKRGENRYWSASSIRRILTSEIYIGRYFYNRRKFSRIRGEKTSGGRPKRKYVYRDRSEWIEVEVPGIVDEALFEMAQRQREKNRKTFSGNIKNEYLLRSLLRCGKCGHAWVCTTYPGKKGQAYPVYRCSNRYPRKFGSDEIQRCDAKTIRADLLDEYVWNQIEELALCPKVLFQAFQSREEANAAALEEGLKAIECQILAKVREREKLKRMFVLEVISEEEMKHSVTRVNMEIERLRKEAERYMKLLDNGGKNMKSYFTHLLDFVQKRIVSGKVDEGMALPFRLKRNILEMLIDEIVVEYHGEEVVLSYVGVLDELLKNKLLGTDGSFYSVGSNT